MYAQGRARYADAAGSERLGRVTLEIIEEMPLPDEFLALYGAVGWSTYTDDPARLLSALQHSTWVLTARRKGELLGLARVISDRHTIAYLQDLLVAPEAQRSGVGGSLLDEVLRRCSDIRQVVLLTDAEDRQRLFYESHGLREVHDVEPAPLRSFVRLM
ncbi:hypothetical protein GCM10009616_37780 [Microlunatus lacustris]